MVIEYKCKTGAQAAADRYVRIHPDYGQVWLVKGVECALFKLGRTRGYAWVPIAP